MIILVIRTLILYGTVIISLRTMGKRQLGELQPSELVVAIMISDLASVPMQAIDIPILTGIIPVLTLIIAEVFMSYLSLKSRNMRKFLTGKPNIVIYDGQIKEKELAKLRFNINDLLGELRLQGYYNISDVEVAVIETSGKLSVLPKDTARGVTVEDMEIKNPFKEGLPCTLISDGAINRDEIARSGKSEKWLMTQLKKQGIDSVKQVFIASLDAENKLYVQKKEAKK